MPLSSSSARFRSRRKLVLRHFTDTASLSMVLCLWLERLIAAVATLQAKSIPLPSITTSGSPWERTFLSCTLFIHHKSNLCAALMWPFPAETTLDGRSALAKVTCSWERLVVPPPSAPTSWRPALYFTLECASIPSPSLPWAEGLS